MARIKHIALSTDDPVKTAEFVRRQGIHHIGFYVDDLEEMRTAMEAASCTECPGSSKMNRTFKGPDGVMIDIRARGWDEQIKARMQLYELTPAAP